MDANESTTDRDAVSIFTHLEDLGLVSAYNLVTLDTNTYPSTYIRGSRCLDYIYVTRPLLERIKSVTIHPFGTAFSSDHRPITIQLHTGRLSYDLTRVSYRHIHTNQIKKSTAFGEYLRTTMEYHKIQDRMDIVASQLNIQPTDALKQTWNRFDREKDRYIKAGIRRFSKGVHETPWSRPLAGSGCIDRYWKERLRAFQHCYTIHDKWEKIR